MGKVWPTLRAPALRARHRAETAFRSLLRRKTRRFDWQALRFDDEHRTADDALLPRSSICRCLPVAFIAGWLSNMAADLRRAAVPVPAKRPSTATGAAMPEASATRAADDERRRQDCQPLPCPSP